MSVLRVHEDEPGATEKGTVGLVSLFHFQSKGEKQKIKAFLLLYSR